MGLEQRRTTDGLLQGSGPYGGNKKGMAIGERARQYELASKIWGAYIAAKSVEGRSGASLDLKTVVSKEVLTKLRAGIREEDVVMLGKIPDDSLTSDDRYLHAGQVEFLRGVLRIIGELSEGKSGVLTCDSLAKTFREEASKFIVAKPGAGSPPDWDIGRGGIDWDDDFTL